MAHEPVHGAGARGRPRGRTPRRRVRAIMGAQVPMMRLAATVAVSRFSCALLETLSKLDDSLVTLARQIGRAQGSARTKQLEQNRGRLEEQSRTIKDVRASAARARARVRA